jgi:hypothetical protein
MKKIYRVSPKYLLIFVVMKKIGLGCGWGGLEKICCFAQFFHKRYSIVLLKMILSNLDKIRTNLNSRTQITPKTMQVIQSKMKALLTQQQQQPRQKERKTARE